MAKATGRLDVDQTLERSGHAGRHQAFQFGQAETAGGTALALVLQRRQIESGCEVGADLVLRNVEAVADDAAVRSAFVLAALDGYERAQITGLCREGAWEAAIDAMRMLALTRLPDPGLTEPAVPPPPGPSSA